MISQLKLTDEKIQKRVDEQTRKIFENKFQLEGLNKKLTQFKKAVDNASDFITIVDKNIQILYVNKSFEKEFGYTSKEIIGETPSKLFRLSEDKKKITTMWDILKKEKLPLVKELETTRKDGSVFISEVHITPILNEEANIIFYLLVEHDITKNREIDMLKNEFIAIASHELRTPMTVINGYVSLFLKEKL